ncbi:MAG: hypothetical protein U0930_08465 [Pirellulales bacterium]
MTQFKLLVGSLITLLCVVSASYCSDNVDAEKAKELVQAALKAEVSGNLDDRDRLLNQAREVSKTEPSANWQAGKVRVGKEWKSYAELVEQAKKSKYLEEYRTLRDQSQPNIESQLVLANYCRRHGLKEQAIAHWSAIVELDPDNREARKQLGFQWVDGRWIRLSERDKELANTRALQWHCSRRPLNCES